MRRRTFCALMGGAIAWPLAAGAQPSSAGKRRIGVLMPYSENDPAGIARVRSFRDGLRELGWPEGSKIDLEICHASNVDLIESCAVKLVRALPDVIVVNSSPATLALFRQTKAIPIVAAGVSDPINEGLVTSIARPGGNVSGFTNFDPPIGGKWLEILKEIAPNITRVGFLYHPQTMSNLGYERAAESVAKSFNVVIEPLDANKAEAIRKTISEFAARPDGGLIIAPDAGINSNYELIVSLAADFKLPAIYAYRFFAAHGGLVSYGPDQIDTFRRAAGYVDRILKGERVGDLPVQNPTKYEMIINLKTARALNLSVPATLQARADEMIE
jgi:putative tryptophan/tyrosine transport system substrate-binding protein